MDDPKEKIYPMPILAAGQDLTLVGRIRKDESIENGINLWVCADNIEKGAATNAVRLQKYSERLSVISVDLKKLKTP